MADATTDDVTMDTLDALIMESIETIRYSEKKHPDEHAIYAILRKERSLSEVKLADSNDRLPFLIKEEKIKNQPSNCKNSYLFLNKNTDTSNEKVSETDNATPTITTCLCANDLNSIKEHISALNTEVITMQSFILEQMVILKKLAPPV